MLTIRLRTADPINPILAMVELFPEHVQIRFVDSYDAMTLRGSVPLYRQLESFGTVIVSGTTPDDIREFNTKAIVPIEL